MFFPEGGSSIECPDWIYNIPKGFNLVLVVFSLTFSPCSSKTKYSMTQQPLEYKYFFLLSCCCPQDRNCGWREGCQLADGAMATRTCTSERVSEPRAASAAGSASALLRPSVPESSERKCSPLPWLLFPLVRIKASSEICPSFSIIISSFFPLRLVG